MLLAIILFPIYWMVSTSLKTQNQTFAIPPELIFVPTLEHYQQVFTEGRVIGALLNSLIVASGSTVLAVVLGTPAAYVLARFQFRGRDQLWFWFITNRFITPIVVAVPFFLIARNAGLVDTRLALILVYLTFNLPLVVWLCVDQFRAIPKDIDEAAMVDGADLFRTFALVSLPLAVPSIAVSAILCFILSWNEFLFALVLTRDNAGTAPVEAANFMTGFGVVWGPMMATATLIVLPVLLFSILVSRHIVRGLTMGAFK
jgi:multiple sugar transport system permease protein